MTSRRKITALTQAAAKYNCAVLIRTGGVPGIMFAKAREEDEVKEWVSRVRDLRYKDYRLVAKPEAMASSAIEGLRMVGDRPWKWGSVREVGSVKEFAAEMQEEIGEEGVDWWRRKMGFVSD